MPKQSNKAPSRPLNERAPMFVLAQVLENLAKDEPDKELAQGQRQFARKMRKKAMTMS